MKVLRSKHEHDENCTEKEIYEENHKKTCINPSNLVVADAFLKDYWCHDGALSHSSQLLLINNLLVEPLFVGGLSGRGSVLIEWPNMNHRWSWFLKF